MSPYHETSRLRGPLLPRLLKSLVYICLLLNSPTCHAAPRSMLQASTPVIKVARAKSRYHVPDQRCKQAMPATLPARVCFLLWKCKEGMCDQELSISPRPAAPSQTCDAIQATPGAAPAAGASSNEGNADDVSGLLIGGTLVPDQLMHGIVVILRLDGSLGEVQVISHVHACHTLSLAWADSPKCSAAGACPCSVRLGIR